MALSTALGVVWVLRYFTLMAISSASLKSKVKGGSVNLADYQSTFEAALNFGPQHQCSQRHFSAGFILKQQRKGGLTLCQRGQKSSKCTSCSQSGDRLQPNSLSWDINFLVTVSVKPFMAWGCDHNHAGLGKFRPISWLSLWKSIKSQESHKS